MQPNTPLSPNSQPAMQNPVTTPVQQPAPAEPMDTGQVVATAKSLVTHYKQDPFRLSMELEQLKSAYLQSQYHISVNDPEH